MLEGDKAPAFTLQDQNGEKVKLSDLKGQTVVVYFYPRADTPGCTTQACGIRDRSDEYAAAGARVIGISPDEVEEIAKFAGKFDLEFTLLADPDHAVAEKYGAWGEKSMYGKKYMGVLRNTYIVDAKARSPRSSPRCSRKSTTTSCSRRSPSSETAVARAPLRPPGAPVSRAPARAARSAGSCPVRVFGRSSTNSIRRG